MHFLTRFHFHCNSYLICVVYKHSFSLKINPTSCCYYYFGEGKTYASILYTIHYIEDEKKTSSINSGDLFTFACSGDYCTIATVCFTVLCAVMEWMRQKIELFSFIICFYLQKKHFSTLNMNSTIFVKKKILTWFAWTHNAASFFTRRWWWFVIFFSSS